MKESKELIFFKHQIKHFEEKNRYNGNLALPFSLNNKDLSFFSLQEKVCLKLLLLINPSVIGEDIPNKIYSTKKVVSEKFVVQNVISNKSLEPNLIFEHITTTKLDYHDYKVITKAITNKRMFELLNQRIIFFSKSDYYSSIMRIIDTILSDKINLNDKMNKNLYQNLFDAISHVNADFLNQFTDNFLTYNKTIQNWQEQIYKLANNYNESPYRKSGGYEPDTINILQKVINNYQDFVVDANQDYIYYNSPIKPATIKNVLKWISKN